MRPPCAPLAPPPPVLLLPLLLLLGSALATGAADSKGAPVSARRQSGQGRADPSSSWLSYARYDAGAIITAMNLSTVVPQNPAKVGADPSFWFGLQTAKGTGALIQRAPAALSFSSSQRWLDLLENGTDRIRPHPCPRSQGFVV
eukprot:SAG31_NODE_1824_length_7190_cov_43.812015_5_plen_144_part_00